MYSEYYRVDTFEIVVPFAQPHINGSYQLNFYIPSIEIDAGILHHDALTCTAIATRHHHPFPPQKNLSNKTQDRA
jgi:hypothetical protein